MVRASKPTLRSDPSRRQAVIYARVSSKEQEKEGFSIPAQLKLLKEYAAAQGFCIAQEYVDVETAKQTGRTAFGEMVGYLKARPAVRVLLVEKTDRLYRNLKDWGDGGRAGCRNPLSQGRRGAVARVAILGKVHARHQGADGEELHRQSVGGGAQGHAGESRAGHLADGGPPGLPECRRTRWKEDHRA